MALARLLARYWIIASRPGALFSLPYFCLQQRRSDSTSSFSLRWAEVRPYNAIRVQLGAGGGLESDVAGFRAALRC